MGVVKEIQSFFHNITTDDHYASYDDYLGDQTASAQNGRNQRNGQSGVSMINNTSSASLQNRADNGDSAPGSSNGPVRYNPGMRSQQAAKGSSGIQMQECVNGSSPLPSISEIWNRLDKWMDHEFPELGDDMEDGATVNDLNAFEKDLNISLPLDVRESYKIHDGELSLGKLRGLIFSYPLLDLESMANETKIWRKVAIRLQRKGEYYHDNTNETGSSFQQQKNKHAKFLSNQKSVPEGAISPVYCDPNWIPFAKDNVGNNIAIDLAPGPRGHWGQVIVFGRDFDTKVVAASSFTEFLFSLCEDLEDGKYVLDDDENLIYCDHGREFEYFNVLQMRAYTRYHYNPARKHVQRKQKPSSPTESKPQRKKPESSTESKPIALPKETLISPDSDKPVDKNDKKSSFVIDEEELALSNDKTEGDIAKITDAIENVKVDDKEKKSDDKKKKIKVPKILKHTDKKLIVTEPEEE